MTPFSLNIHGRLIEFDRPLVMGIINATPDSFYASSRHYDAVSVGNAASQMIADGADIIDLGCCSTRPGADQVNEKEEISRLRSAMTEIRKEIGYDTIISVDTYRASVARIAVEEYGVSIINDISGGDIDPKMFETVAELHVPYILMHMRGTPANMSAFTDYAGNDVTAGVISELSEKVRKLHLAGVSDIIIDPGLGFAKTLDQNYELLRELPAIEAAFQLPVLIGLSRKSMLTRLLDISADEALEATVAANMIALMQGAAILRVHDVKAARQSIRIFSHTFNHSC